MANLFRCGGTAKTSYDWLATNSGLITGSCGVGTGSIASVTVDTSTNTLRRYAGRAGTASLTTPNIDVSKYNRVKISCSIGTNWYYSVTAKGNGSTTLYSNTGGSSGVENTYTYNDVIIDVSDYDTFNMSLLMGTNGNLTFDLRFTQILLYNE